MKKLGFGCMRLPMNGDEVDEIEFQKMVDYFMKEGFTYFDTARVYIGGKSELALKKCLTSKYPRDSYTFTNKLSNIFNSEEDIIPLFNSQLESCGLTYFDYYLMHAQGARVYPKYCKCHAYEIAKKLKEEGKIKHIGISFHDSASYLEKILSEQPDIEVVQLQFNYLDQDNPRVESKACYDVCMKYHKKVLVMEPVKGGYLANLPLEATNILTALNNGSAASYAIRYAASFENIMVVLSGMSNMDQMLDNTSYMKDFKPLNTQEQQAIENVRDVLLNKEVIECTSCKYCEPGCPKHIKIFQLFSYMNGVKQYNDHGMDRRYREFTALEGKASSCIKCGKCEAICPQHLKIRDLLVDVAKEFEK